MPSDTPSVATVQNTNNQARGSAVRWSSSELVVLVMEVDEEEEEDHGTDTTVQPCSTSTCLNNQANKTQVHTVHTVTMRRNE